MNILKFGRGEFFGIIIPGAFLLINILLFFPLQKIGINISQYSIDNKEGAIATSLFVISYIIGFSLRLLKPDLIEKVSFCCWTPYLFILSIRETFKKNETFKTILFSKLRIYWESFPYINWFYDSYLNNTPNSIQFIFNEILEKEFSGDRKLMEKQTFVNQCKLYVRNKSTSLNEEIMFCEGLVRFLSGMTYALIFSIAILLYFDHFNQPLLFTYISLILLFVLKLRHMRFKEVATIFSAFAYSMTSS